VANERLYALDVANFPKLDGKLKRRLMTMKGQARLVFEELDRVRTPRTIAEIAATIDVAALKSVQPAWKVVGYYVVTWKTQGVVAAYAPAETDDTSIDEAFAKMFPSEEVKSDE
jgi:hypothetical protein